MTGQALYFAQENIITPEVYDKTLNIENIEMRKREIFKSQYILD